MKTFRFLQKAFYVSFMAVAMAACGSDGDSTDGNVNPDANVNDPAGTVSLSMMKGSSPREGATTIGSSSMYIGNDYNFTNGNFVSLGTVKGLGNVSYIPTAGWANSMAVRKGSGYVAYGNGAFYRIFAENEIAGTTGGVIGYDVKYQTPFKGKDLDLDIQATALSFDKSGGSENLVFGNKEFVVFSAQSSADWCQVLPTSTYDNYFLSNGVQIIVQPSGVAKTTEATVTLTTAYGKKKEIKVTRGGVEPYISLNESSVTLDAKKTERQVSLNTNIPKEDLEISNTASSWCKAELVDQTKAMHAKAAKVKFVGNKPATAMKASGSANYYTLSLEASANDKETERTGTVTLKSKDGKKSVALNVTQQKGYLYVNYLGYNETELGKEATDSRIGNVYSSIAHDELQVSCNEVWCKPTLTSPDQWGNPCLRIETSQNVTEKTRAAKVVISNKTKSMSFTLNVKQRGILFTPSQTKVGFDKNQSNKTIAISTNLDWEATSNQSWCTVSKNGNNLTIRATSYTGSAASRKATISFKGLSTKIEVDQSKYAVGDQYSENGVKGEVAYMKDTVRYVKRDVGKSVWSTESIETGATDLDDGTKNMFVIKKISGWKTLYPAFALCDALNVGGVTGWYLPAYSELKRIKMETGWYWSSTEDRAYTAYCFSSSSSTSYLSYRKVDTELLVMAVHKF